MSRKSRFEYIGEKRRAYAKSGKAKRSRIIDEVCETLGYTRKYVIKLLTGNIRYRERKGRGRTYGASVLENVRRIWETVGCPCTTYFVAELPRIVREYEACVALIKPKEDRDAILSMGRNGALPARWWVVVLPLSADGDWARTLFCPGRWAPPRPPRPPWSALARRLFGPGSS